MNALISLVAKVILGYIEGALARLDLRRQGAQEQREKDRKAENEQLKKVVEARDADRTGDGFTHGVRDGDFRD